MTQKHTPGPWGLQTVRTSCGVCHKVGPWPHKWRAGEEMAACIYDDYPSPPEGTDTMLANARLIAAAPDFSSASPRAVEMLRIASEFIREHAAEFTAFYDDTECDGYCISEDCAAAAEALDAAIARATGAA